MAVDRIDIGLLEALQNDARVTHKELGAKVTLAPSSVHARIKKLSDAGIIRGFHADVEPKSLGIGLMALIAVKMQDHSREAFDAFRERIMKRQEVRSLYQLAGADDFLVHVAVRDSDHLRDVVLDAFLSCADITHLETSLIFDHLRNSTLPSYV